MMEELALHIMDVLQNSLAAGARNVELDIEENSDEDLLTIRVRDDGKGMTKEELEKVQDPFYTTKRDMGVGLGIPMFKWVAEHCDGHFSMESSPGRGTTLEATFRLSHIDRPPIGDLASTIFGLVASCPDVRLLIRYKGIDGEFVFDSKEVKDMLGEVPISDAHVLRFLKEYIGGNLRDVMGTA
jgi:anti-sigma regulatory factor (Ser/Thr protein kinase)